jgi:hypothetical protein
MHLSDNRARSAVCNKRDCPNIRSLPPRRVSHCWAHRSPVHALQTMPAFAPSYSCKRHVHTRE